jgi:hypothetical protein
VLNIADCRSLAIQCHTLAGKPEVSENRRKALLEIATTWDHLAAELIKNQWRARRFLGEADIAAGAMSMLASLHRRG